MATDNDIVHTAAEALVIFSNRDHSAAATAGPSSAVPSCSNSAAPSQPSCSSSSLQAQSRDCSLLLPDDLKQNLECPVCTRISLPPIMQCRNGHVTCNPCRLKVFISIFNVHKFIFVLKVQSCPMCREVDIDIRYHSFPPLIIYNILLETCLRKRQSHLCPFLVSSKPTAVESRFSTKIKKW